MNNYILQIKELVDLRDALCFYGVEFNRAGFAVCPFHTEKTASFSVKKQRYKCFGCGATGDIITFVQDMFGLSLRNAVEKINSDFGLNLPIGANATARERFEADKRYMTLIAEKRKKQDYINSAEKEYERACDMYASTYKSVCEFGNFAGPEDSKAFAAALHKLTIAEYKMDIAGFKLNKALIER